MLLVLLLLHLLLGLIDVEAAPLDGLFQRQTTIDPLTTQDCVCPNTRSTWDIVWSCLVTIFACSWISVHPNIPRPDEDRWKNVLRRLELMFWSIVSPELIIFWALKQWIAARQLAEEYREKGWTMIHGYFIQMGGFMLYDGNKPIGVLGPQKLADLLDKQKVAMPEIAEKDIQDRSKSDALSKGLVIIQTTWFIAQCVARRVRGLIITELELVTLAFAALNIFMYACWWNKPLDVQTTVPVYLLDPSPLQVVNQEGTLADETTNHSIDSSDRGNETSNLQGINIEHETLADGSRYRPVNWLNFLVVTRQMWWVISGILIRWSAAGVVSVLDRIEEILASNTIVSGEMFVSTFYAHDHHLGRVVWEDFSIPLVGILFGAIHCAGWNYSFPSLIESNVWRISSAVITGVPAVGVFFVLGVHLSDCFPVNPLVSRTVDVMGLLTIVMLPFYVLARVALLVEALISLRDLSPEALKELEWTSFVPHV